jgi:hypothetical protein
MNSALSHGPTSNLIVIVTYSNNMVYSSVSLEFVCDLFTEALSSPDYTVSSVE